MDYVYDIVLDFQNEYYDFYEWQTNDKIINIKKVPIYKVTNRDYLNIKNHDVTIETISLPKKSTIFLLTSGLEIMGILINKHGQVLKKSSLIFEEADDILTDCDKIKKINIKYHITSKNELTNQSRVNKEKQK